MKKLAKIRAATTTVKAIDKASPSAAMEMHNTFMADEGIRNAQEELRHLRRSYDATGNILDPSPFRNRAAVLDTFGLSDEKLK